VGANSQKRYSASNALASMQADGFSSGQYSGCLEETNILMHKKM
jgi:hypothetical protein